MGPSVLVLTGAVSFACTLLAITTTGVVTARPEAPGQRGAPQTGAPSQREDVWLLKAARAFDGESGELHEGWVVRVRGERIEAFGPPADVAATGARVADMPGATLMPGLLDAHSHVLLHPYSETSWNDQNTHADYRWGPAGESRPTFSLDELRLIVETAASSGRPVSAHANTMEGMRRAALAGVETIEHGGEGSPEVFKTNGGGEGGVVPDALSRRIGHPRASGAQRARA